MLHVKVPYTSLSS